jgi:hypothetical protein
MCRCKRLSRKNATNVLFSVNFVASKCGEAVANAWKSALFYGFRAIRAMQADGAILPC